jgi:hypothetical protein
MRICCCAKTRQINNIVVLQFRTPCISYLVCSTKMYPQSVRPLLAHSKWLLWAALATEGSTYVFMTSHIELRHRIYVAWKSFDWDPP